MKYSMDFRGVSCPTPVIEVKKMITKGQVGDIVELIVDNEIAVQNITKMAQQYRLEISSNQEEANSYRVILKIIYNIDKTVAPVRYDKEDNTIIVISSDKMGEGDETLGRILLKGFIYALTELEILPKTILFYNNGAKIPVEDSESLADLKLLQSQGVEILTCGTCLNHYGLTEKLAVGTVTNMYAILEKQMNGTKVIKL